LDFVLAGLNQLQKVVLFGASTPGPWKGSGNSQYVTEVSRIDGSKW